MMKKWLKMALTSATAAVLVLGAAISVAHAERPPQPKVDPSQINPNQAISLTVHKYTAPAGDSHTGGKEAKPTDLPAGAKPVTGVEFTWQKVNPDQINLLTNQGWKDAAAVAKKFNVNHNPDDLKKGEEKLTFPKTGNGKTVDGKVKFTFPANENPAGLYLITETNVADATVDGKKVTVSPALPFLVTLPLTDISDNPDGDTARTTWNYDVHVYPKNAVVEIKKEVDDSATVAAKSGNSALTYTLKSDIPLRSGEKMTDKPPTPLDKYLVMDKTDPAKVTIDDKKVTVQYCLPTKDPKAPKCSDALPEHYTKSLDNGLLKISFTEAGLKELGKKRAEAEAAEAGISKQAYVKTTVPVTLIAEAAEGTTTNDLGNTAYLVPDKEHGENLPPDPNNPTTPSDQPGGKLPPIPSNKVVSKFAKIKLNKADDDGNNLAGAVFGLYTCTINNTSDKLTFTAGSQAPVMKDQQPVTATSADNGEVIFPQVRVSDFAKNEQLANSDAPGYQGYCVKEIKAPKGYELTPEFIPVDVKNASVSNGVYTLSEKIVNVKENAGFKLPLTGSVASLALLVAAGVLMVGGLLLASRRRKEQA